MENGASGYIPKEYFIEYDRARGEILSIIAQYRLPGVSFRPATALDLINHFLQQPDVCFPYWTHFFGRDANEVFTPDALEMLKESKTSELSDCIRIALMRARETNDNTVSTRHLPERFSINVSPARKAELEEISAMRSFLNAVNTLLEIEKSVKQVALKMRITEMELKTKLREYRQKYPDIHIKGDFQHIYRAFPLNLAAYWGTKHEVVFLATDFLNTYLNVLSNDFFFGEPGDADSTLSDKTRGFWTPHLVAFIS